LKLTGGLIVWTSSLDGMVLRLSQLKPDILKQIISNQEDAEKWDEHLSLMIQSESCIEQIIEENKQLKERLRKFEVLQYTPNELEIELNKKISLKLENDELRAQIAKVGGKVTKEGESHE